METKNSSKTQTKKVIVLSRVSTVYQDVTQQTDAIMKQVRNDGFDESSVIVIENKESGSKLSFEEREGLTELFRIIEEDPSRISAVYCFEISRLGRKPDVVFKVRDFLIKYGINLICVKPYFRMLDDNGKVSESSSIMFGLFAVMAESETRTRVERTMRGKNKNKAEKKWNGGWIRFGYSVDPTTRKYILNDDAETVKWIFQTYSEGKLSFYSIAKELMEMGKIHHSNIERGVGFIAKLINATEYYDEKIYPAIISEELFQKCMSLKSNKLAQLKPKSNHKNIYYASGILFNKDGYLLSGVSGVGAYKNRFYHQNVSINIVDSIIWEIAKLHRISFSREKSEDTLRKLIDDIATLEQKIEVLSQKIEENKKRQDKIEIRLIMGKISDEAATLLENEIQSDTDQIKHVIASLSGELHLKNSEYASFDMRNNRIVENLEEIQDDETRAKIIHEEITKIVFERISNIEFQLHVTCFDETRPTIYQVVGHSAKCSVSGIPFPYKKLGRYTGTHFKGKQKTPRK